MSKFDVVIKGGTVIDGLRTSRYKADVGIAGGRVVAIGRVDASDGREVVDASNKVVAPGFVDGPAALDVSIATVVTCVDTSVWLSQALGDTQLDDGRTQAQVVVGQAEFADVVVLNRADPFVAAVLRRLSPRARIRVGADGIEHALDNLYRDARRGRSDDPHGPLLAGEPPLNSRGPVNLVDCTALDYVQGACARDGECVSSGLWHRIKVSVEAILDQTTLDDLIHGHRFGRIDCKDVVDSHLHDHVRHTGGGENIAIKPGQCLRRGCRCRR